MSSTSLYQIYAYTKSWCWCWCWCFSCVHQCVVSVLHHHTAAHSSTQHFTHLSCTRRQQGRWQSCVVHESAASGTRNNYGYLCKPGKIRKVWLYSLSTTLLQTRLRSNCLYTIYYLHFPHVKIKCFVVDLAYNTIENYTTLKLPLHS